MGGGSTIQGRVLSRFYSLTTWNVGHFILRSKRPHDPCSLRLAAFSLPRKMEGRYSSPHTVQVQLYNLHPAWI